MEIQQLNYFLQICEDRNFAVAADKLFISQQALRKSIKKAENEIGLELFYKKGNQLCLTTAGETVRAYANLIKQNLDSMDTTLQAFRDEPGYTEITVVMANGCYDRLADICIEPYKKLHPNIGIRLIEVADLTCESYIIRGIADFGFCFGPNDTNIFDVYCIGSEPMYTLVNKENPLATKDVLEISDFRGVKVGIANELFKLYYNFSRACRDAGFEPLIDFKGADPYSVHQYSHITKNISVTSGDCCREFAKSNQVAIPVNAPGYGVDFNIIIRKNISLNREAWRFIDYCKETLHATSPSA